MDLDLDLEEIQLLEVDLDFSKDLLVVLPTTKVSNILDWMVDSDLVWTQGLDLDWTLVLDLDWTQDSDLDWTLVSDQDWTKDLDLD